VVAKQPDLCLARIAHATNLGRLGMFSENKEKVRLAGVVKENALVALELEPSQDLALHILGRWEFEMASIGPVVRALAKMLYADMGQGCMLRAAGCFERAIEKCPTKLIHRVMVAKCYLKMNKKIEARENLMQAMKLKVEDVNARNERADGVRMLKKHWGLIAPNAPPMVEDPTLVEQLSHTLKAVSSCASLSEVSKELCAKVS